MKANEAPEKIYLLPRQGGDYAPYWKTDSQDGFGIEYVRTDVFIKRACEFLKSYRQETYDGTGYIAGIVNDETIEDFKKYIKGE